MQLKLSNVLITRVIESEKWKSRSYLCMHQDEKTGFFTQTTFSEKVEEFPKPSFVYGQRLDSLYFNAFFGREGKLRLSLIRDDKDKKVVK